MTLDLTFFAVAVPAVLFAAIAKAGFGGGVSFVAAAILALMIPPGLAIGLMLPLMLLIDIGAVRAFWGQWHRPSVVWLCIGSLPGLILGALLFAFVDADVFRVLIGAICLLFVAFRVARRAGWISSERTPFRRDAAGLAGFVAGFASFISHAGGPPVAIFLLGQGLSKTAYQSTVVLVFWVQNLAKVPPYAALGLFTRETLLAGLLLAPVALVGTWAGVRAHHVVPERLFFSVTYVLLVLTGLRLVWVGLS